ncbi:peptidyl-prolyl cis-trans isomerase [Novosphingobium sp.]|uniref:peptidylprolyl isomerase n=1 Tax=Novosphingobium sp. TaxID=1874826 RepID=UPI0035B10428
MTMRSRAAAMLREPLVHFLIAGALVFAFLSGRAPDLGERRIVVNEAVVGGIANRFVETFHRQPSNEELDGLINDYVRDQVYYREALRLGLDRDDEVVVRRMRNKMVALATSDADAATPSDADLQKLLEKDPGRYAREPQITFSQLYLGADSPAAREAAKQALAVLAKGGDATAFTKPAPITAHFEAAPSSDIAEQFGDQFAAALPKQQRGQWHVMTSGLGLHLVKVEALIAPAPPTLDQVRQQLTNDWHEAAVRKAENDAYAKILAGYDVVIEQPK